MRRLALTLLALLALRTDASAQCRGDLNQNGRADVSDAIAVVGEILNGCGGAATATEARTPAPTEAPTPTVAVASCPHDFDTHRYETEDRTCAYQGDVTDCTGSSTGTAIWWNVLGGYVFAVADGAGGPLAVLGVRQHQRRARIEAAYLGRDLEEQYTASGLIRLEPPEMNFRADTRGAPCRYLLFSGNFAGTVDAQEEISLESALTRARAMLAQRSDR